MTKILQHPNETVDMWLARIFKHEGGYTDDKNDPGNWTGGKVGAGELKGTKYGVAANTYNHLDIKNITLADARDIYIKDFLLPIRAYEHEDGVAYQLLCFAVNSGPRRALMSLQKAIDVKPDGVIGPVTLSKLRGFSESDLIMLVIAERIDFMRGLSNWVHHGNGWMGRIADNLRYGALDS
jgi:lysozyme family protein